MGSPIRVAFCHLFYMDNGGPFAEHPKGVLIAPGVRALPVRGVERDITDGFPPRSMCDHPNDCGTCPILTKFVQKFIAQGWSVGWECADCLKWVKKESEAASIDWELPGFYQTGKLPREPDDPDYDRDPTVLQGCTNCSFESSFLQLVLRRKKGDHG